MAQILYRGLLSEYHSWAIVGAELCNALINLGYDIALQPTDKKANIRASLKPYLDGEHKRAHIGIGYTIPRNLKVFNADRKVCIYNYETTMMPPGWIKDMNQQADLILPSSNFAKNIFVQNGVLRNKIQVLPHGIDPAVYHPGVAPFNFGTNKFVFLCVAQPHARKGLDILLRAYAKEFASTEDVCLIIKTSLISRRRAHYEIDVRELLNRIRKQYSLPEIKVVTEKFENLASLYTASDCFVLPTRSECFCLPALEAMACKTPVIITGYGGQTDFATRVTSFLISYKMVSAPREMQYWHFDPRGKIAEPDEEHLRVLMRYVFKDRQESCKRAELAYEQILPRYTWENVGEQLMSLIRQQNWAKRYKFERKRPGTAAAVDTQIMEQTRDKRYHRVVAQRQERLQTLEQEIATKQEEVERLRKQIVTAKTIQDKQRYKSLTRAYSGKVSIIILSYNTKLATIACIDSIQQHTRNIEYEIVVVDNGSTDGSVEALRSRSDVTLVENSKNVGVSRGWNQGINLADSRNDIVVLNSDIIVGDNWLAKINKTAYSDPTIGVVGCRMKGHKFHDGHVLHTGALIKKDGMGEENEWGIPLKDYGQYQVNREVQIVVGACMYLKREALEKVGLFDEQFSPAYFEDSDMCLKMTQAGYKVFYCGQVTLLHEHGATSRANGINAASLLASNRVKFVNKWGSYLSKKEGRIEIKGPIYGNSGYAEACRNLVLGLWENNVDVAFRPITVHLPSSVHHITTLIW
jgi:GT2 family glycosyltransferase/glycosyltransferase involved in cell wall biosynthesis